LSIENTNPEVQDSPAKDAARTDERRGKKPSVARRVVTVLISIVALAGSFAGGVAFYHHYEYGQRVVVDVNGADITQQDMFNRLEKVGGRDVLRQLVTESIQVQYAKQRGVLPTNAVVQKAVAAALSDPAFQRQMIDTGESPDAYFREVQVNLAKAAVVTEGITVSDAEVKAYYDENARHDNVHSRFYTPETTTLQVIRNHSQKMIDAADHDLRNGRDFAAVVADYSTDQSKGNQGISPALIRGRNNMRKVPGMEEAIFNIDIGQTLGPKQYAGDWWILKCIDKTPASTVPFERAQIEATIGAKMAKVTPQRIAAVQSDFERFQKGVDVEVFWPKYKDAVILK